MSRIKTRGVTLRRSVFGEGDKYLTILAEGCGKISAAVKGASKTSGKLFAAAHPFVYCEFLIFCKGGYMRVTEAEVIYPFGKLSDDYNALCLGLYFLEITDKTVGEGLNQDGLLRLLLFALLSAERKKISLRLTRAVFEFKLLSLMGFEPFLERCVACGGADAPYFRADGLYCPRCARRPNVELSPASREALLYILASPPKVAFAFAVAPYAENELARAAALCRAENFNETAALKSEGLLGDL